MLSLRHAMATSALIVLAMTGAVYVHTTRAPRAPGPVRRTGGLGPPVNDTAVPTVQANASAHARALPVPLVPVLPRGAPFWVSNASAKASAANMTAALD
jgi:hypothetical protein